MKKQFIPLCLFLFGVMGANAQTSGVGRATVRDLEVKNVNDSLHISMTIDANTFELKSNHEIKLSPMLISGEQNMALPEVCFMGRNRYIRYLRNKQIDSPYVVRAGMVPNLRYETSVPMEDWMRESELVLLDNICGCSDQVLLGNKDLLAKIDLAPKRFEPVFVYQTPVVEEKHRELSGSAFIDFPVGKSEIATGYRNNGEELQKIYKTIDSVKDDPDVEINGIRIKGFASPEGSFELNTRLAKGRTESLKRHVQHLYSFDSGVIRSDFEAEDWEGLRTYVESSYLPHKQEILEIIDNGMDPDQKEWKIKSTYPEDYKRLLTECYPSLRHSDYVVDYTVRAYTDVEEAKRVMQDRPGNLSVHEFYQVANSYEPGSEAYNNTFDTMVMIYPNDETANLNAANVAMARGDMDSAARFLRKAGKSAEAAYARGVYYSIKGDYRSAARYLKAAAKAGVTQATDALQQIKNLQR